MTAKERNGREVQNHSSRTLGKVLYWVGLAVSILLILPLPGWAFGGWMGSKAFTGKGRDLWLGRGIGCWLGLFALFLFLLSDKREPAQQLEPIVKRLSWRGVERGPLASEDAAPGRHWVLESLLLCLDEGDGPGG